MVHIIGLYTKEEVGTTIGGSYLRNLGEEHHDVVFRIVGEATYEEWKQFREENGLDPLGVDFSRAAYYYKAMTD